MFCDNSIISLGVADNRLRTDGRTDGRPDGQPDRCLDGRKDTGNLICPTSLKLCHKHTIKSMLDFFGGGGGYVSLANFHQDTLLCNICNSQGMKNIPQIFLKYVN